MKTNKYSFLPAMFLCLFVVHSGAQVPKPCGEPKTNMQALLKANNYASLYQQNLAVNQLLRVYFHIVRNDDGSNAGATELQIQNEFKQLVADYQSNNICFAYMGLDFIDNSLINNSLNADNASNVAWLTPFLVPGCLNIFYQAAILGNGGTTYGGNAYAIPNTFCSIARGNISFQRTLSHEVGHCLGLQHTFAAINNSIEFINGTDCVNRGDGVCDTPADPYRFRGTACFTNTGCLYTGSCTDPNGSSNYAPPYNNLMGYWEQLGCNRTAITTGQFARANNFLGSDAGLKDTQSPASVIYGPTKITSGYEMRSSIFDLTTTGNIFIGGTAEASLQGQSVVLTTGFIASPSNGLLLVRLTSCSY